MVPVLDMHTIVTWVVWDIHLAQEVIRALRLGLGLYLLPALSDPVQPGLLWYSWFV